MEKFKNPFNFKMNSYNLIFLCCVSVLSVVELIIKPYGNFPLNDDWVYALDSINSFLNKKYTITYFETAWGIPNVLLGIFLLNFFNFHHALFRIIGVFSLVASSYFLFLYLRKINNNKYFLIISLLTYIFYVPQLTVANTFMTDMPFAMFWIATCYFWDNAFEKIKTSFLWYGFIFFCLCVAQRQFGVLLLISITSLFLLQDKKSSNLTIFRIHAFGVCFLGLLVFLILNFWWQSINGQVPSSTIDTSIKGLFKGIYSRSFKTFHYLGLLLFPLSIFFILSSETLKNLYKERLRTEFSFVKIFLFLIPFLFFAQTLYYMTLGNWMPYFNNQLSVYGIFFHDVILCGSRPLLLDGWFPILLTIISTFTCLIFLIYYLWYKKIEFPLRFKYGYVLICSGVIYFLLMVTRYIIFDRYFLPFVPALFVIIAYHRFRFTKWNITISILLIIINIIFSTTILYDYFRSNEARWNLANNLESRGVSRLDINAGYEWNGFKNNINKHFPDIKNDKYVVAFSPISGYRVDQIETYVSIWSPHIKKMYLLVNSVKE